MNQDNQVGIVMGCRLDECIAKFEVAEDTFVLGCEAI
jgi:hypothetical protein